MALPVRLLISYILDWVIVIIVAVAGGVLNYVSGFHRPFSLADIDIAYPLKANIVSVPVLVLVALVAPFAIIVVLSFLGRIFGLRSRGNTTWLQLAWETHAGVLGLCASLAATLFVTSGLKDLVGKTRPDFLARCNADLSKISGFVVGGYGDMVYSESTVLVTPGICRQTNKRILDDGFAAFPSGHSSFACAGLVYLSLWLCARYSLAMPYLSHTAPIDEKTRNGRSAPPLWQLAAALVPIIVALFICASRYADFHHAGFDIICGALLGTLFAWSSFRLYHLPIRRGMGLAWSERSRYYAFFSSGAKYDEEATSVRTQATGGGHELRELENGQPVRANTETSSRPIFDEQR